MNATGLPGGFHPTLLTLDRPVATLPQDGLLTTPAARAALALWAANPGGLLTVQAPDGVYYRGELRPDGYSVRLFHQLPASPEPPGARRLHPAIPDKQRMLWIIQKAVELGATAIQPLHTDRSNPFPAGEDGDALLRTWNRIALQAARQCRRAIIPEVLPPIPLLDYPPLHRTGSICLWADPATSDLLLHAGIGHHLPWQPQDCVDLLIGPEGGWSDTERDWLTRSGGIGVSLGSRLLRTETAALVGLTLLMARDG
jgi:16S rRNA (uracil1498-N3)-methyltransferase